MSEVSLYGICPGTGHGTWPPLLSQNGVDSCRGLAERTWSKPPKTPNRVMVDSGMCWAQRSMNSSREHSNSTLRCQMLVVEPKFDGSFSDECDPTLRDGRPFYVATGVLEEMPFVCE
jgi:hypothetical protein